MKTKEIYHLRDSYSIVGLTGRTGSGCTRFSKIISEHIKFEKNEMIRRPKDINYLSNDISPDNNTIFKRKYSICYNYFKKHNTPFKVISYLSVLTFYSLHYAIKKQLIKNENDLIEFLYQLICDNFKKSIKSIDDDYQNVEISKKEIEAITGKYKEIFNQLKDVKCEFKQIVDIADYELLYKSFYGHEFENFCTNLFSLFAQKDYYLGSFLVHRLGNKIRATGNPTEDGRKLKEKASTEYIYSVVYLINKLIKAWKISSRQETCHICIDSLRNSLEIMFLKERYSAFYMIAIHNEERHKRRIETRIEKSLNDSTYEKNPNPKELIAQKVIRLDETEHDGEDFKNGSFYAPDVENCIQKSDIHINNPGTRIEEFNEGLRRSKFFTMTEQWIKIKSLMLHPGIITPSHEERCMQIAFNAKLNSGCISRQVGAVVTDENNSVRAVGWNDVPKGSIPFNIRTLADIINPVNIHKLDLSYSRFEIETEEKSYKDGGNFSSKSKEKFKTDVQNSERHGLNHSFCFKTLHNKYEGKDNQVHTRSLHAEENAMLQISKFGGQPLKNGILYTTASPCELCAKKAYQLGLSIVYIDPYPGISMKHILVNGYNQPKSRMFTGIIGRAYNKLYEPLLSYKDELSLITTTKPEPSEKMKVKLKNLLEEILGDKIDSEIDIEEIKKALKK